MTRRAQLPSELGAVFAVRDAEAHGISRAARDHPGLLRLFRGTRAVRLEHRGNSYPGEKWAQLEAHARQRIEALWTVMPGHAFLYGPSAALFWGIPLPEAAIEHVHVAVVFPLHPIRRHGVISTRLHPDLADVVQGNQFRALSAAATWASLAPFLDDDDLVAAADFLLCPADDPGGRHPERRSPPICTPDDLHRVLDRGRWRGAPRLRRALAAARVGSRSRRETHLRLRLVGADLPEPALNQDIWDGDLWLACPDLVFKKYRVCVEYQSAYHRTAQQYDADIDRRRRLQSAGWTVVELTFSHVTRSPQEAVRRVADALRERGWRG